MNGRSWRIAVALVVLSACGGGAAYEQELGTNGGTVSTPEGVTIDIPAGALRQPTTISVTPAPDAPAPAGALQVGDAYTFGPEGTQFSVPVKVTLPYEPAKLPAGVTAGDLVIYTAPAGSSAYTALPTAVADATHVFANTSHFSTFLVGGAQQASGGGPQDGGYSGGGDGGGGGEYPEIDSGPPDVGYPDGGFADGGFADGGYADGGVADSGPMDAGYPDAGMADGGAPTDGCPADAGRGTLCGGAYVDVDCDLNNCGACGNACQSGEVCTNGRCG